MTLKINDNGTDRQMTDEEIEAHQQWAVIAKAEAKAQAEAIEAIKAQKAALLNRLGITAEEAKLLLS
jgi:hypothetical protein